MIRIILSLWLVCMCWIGTVFSQETTQKVFSPYLELALGAQLWTSSYKTLGLQLTAGVAIKNRLNLGFGIGLASRNYDYFHFPLELGYDVWNDVGAIRIYGGVTRGYHSNTKGFLGGAELVIKPQLDWREVGVLVALGVAFDEGAGGTYFSPDSKSTRVLGPRLRIGLRI